MGEAILTRAGTGEAIDLPVLGIAMRVLVPAAATAGAFCVIEETTAPGKGPPLHVHREQSECFRFLEGRYLLEVDGTRWEVGPGDTALVPPGARHAFRNVGAAPARLVFTLTPALAGEAFFQGLGALLTAGPPDPARLAAYAEPLGTVFVGPPLDGRG
jgi:mannose-6-phosphate isomerase-like protein (cupin superfamily)